MSFTEADRDRWVTALDDSGLPTLPDSVVKAFHVALNEAVDSPPIPALLPRDWPRQVAQLCERLGASDYVVAEATRLVDDWVLAAGDPS